MSGKSPATSGNRSAPKPRPTLKTISKMTGLAVPTVSRALSDAPDIGESTKEKVRAVARQIGYRPNRAGLRLRTGKTQVISLLLSTTHDATNQTAKLISSIAGGLRGTPYHLIATPFFPDEDPLDSVRYIVESGSADGIIMNQLLPDDPRVHYLRDAGFPFATHGQNNRKHEHAYYDYDHFHLGVIGLEEFARRGRRSATLIAPSPILNYSQDLYNGAQSVAARLPIKARRLGVNSDESLDTIECALSVSLEENPETDAILCTSMTAALAAIAACDERGLEIGKDIELLAREFIPMLNRFRPGILTVLEDVSLAGDYLSRAVLHAIDHPDDEPMQQLEKPVLIR